MNQRIIRNNSGRIVAIINESKEQTNLINILSKDYSEREKFFDFEVFVNELLKYKEEFGDLYVPVAYRSKDTNYPLGSTVSAVRCSKKKLDNHERPHCYILSEEQYAKLDEIGFMWSGRKSFDFERFYKELLKYKEEHGDLLVPTGYPTDKTKFPNAKTKYLLWNYVTKVRTYKRELDNGEALPNSFITDEQIKRLEEIGFVWDAQSFDFDKFVKELVLYKETYGDLNVPTKYINSETGYKLGGQVSRIRHGKKKFDKGYIHYGEYGMLSKEDYDILDDLGFVWDSKITFDFDKFYNELLIFKEKFGDLLVPARYKNLDSGYSLGNIVSLVRISKRKLQNGVKVNNHVLTNEQYKKLEDIGFVWKVRESKKTKDKIEESFSL